MKKLSFSFSLFLSLLFLNVGAAFAQNIYLRGGEFTVKGTMVKGFENYVEISGVQFGAEAEVSFTKGTGPAIGKPTFDAISITKSVDKLSNELLRSIATGKSFPLIEIVVAARNSQGEQRAAHKIELQDVFVTKISDASAQCDDCGTLAESVNFVYKSIKITTYSFDSKTGAPTANANPFEFDVSTMKQDF